jgi:hypothetical protein
MCPSIELHHAKTSLLASLCPSVHLHIKVPKAVNKFYESLQREVSLDLIESLKFSMKFAVMLASPANAHQREQSFN